MLRSALLGVSFVVLCFAQEKALFLTLTNEAAVQKATNIIVPIVSSKIPGLRIPNQAGQIPTIFPNLYIDYQITNIVLSQIQFGAVSSVLAPNSGVTLSMPSINIVTTMNWAYQMGLIQGSGGSTDTISATVVVQLHTGERNGELTLQVSDLRFDITNLNIVLSGNAAWFYDIFVNIFKGQISTALQTAVTQSLANEVNAAIANVLDKTPITFPVQGTPFTFNYALTTAPTVTSQYSATAHAGVLVYTPAPLPVCPYENQAIYLPPTVSQKPLTFIVSETFGNCLAWTLFKTNILHGTVVDSMIPPYVHIHLNTNDPTWKAIFPNITQIYPELPMTLDILANSVPQVTFLEGKDPLELQLELNLILSALNGSQSFPIAEFLMTINLGFNLQVTQPSPQRLIASVVDNSYNITLTFCDVGPVKMDLVEIISKLFVTVGVIPYLNDIGASGIPIPSTFGVELVNSNIVYFNHYVQIATDFATSAEFFE